MFAKRHERVATCYCEARQGVSEMLNDSYSPSPRTRLSLLIHEDLQRTFRYEYNAYLMIASTLYKDDGNGEEDCPPQRSHADAVYLLPIEAGPSQTRGAGNTIQTAEFISQFTRSLHLQLWNLAKKLVLHLIKRHAKRKTPTTLVVSQRSVGSSREVRSKGKCLYLSIPRVDA